MTCQDFLAALPKHKAELILTHNAHTSNYDTVESAVENDDHGYRKDDWISDEQRDLAVANNECWTLQWYIPTPRWGSTLYPPTRLSRCWNMWRERIRDLLPHRLLQSPHAERKASDTAGELAP